jgi:alkylation response protein AidB-like acyl-CoA dehydrogenase
VEGGEVTGGDRATDTQALLDLVDALVEQEIVPRAAAIDAANVFPRDVYAALAKAGLFGIWVPEEYGGTNISLTAKLAIVERIARASASTALIFANCGDAAAVLSLSASEEIKLAYLPAIATGELIPCFALTEPGAGSDAASIQTSARESHGGYKINGHKLFCTNGSVGGVFTVFARTDPSAPGAHGITAFAIPRDTPGLVIEHDEELIGLRGCPNSEITLNDVPVTDSMIVGEKNEGFRVAMVSLDDARLHAAAMSVGIATGAFDTAVKYARERYQFGRPIIEHQGLQFLLADMATQISAARSLLKVAAEGLELDRSRPASLFAAMTKLFATDVGMKTTVDCVQVLGGYGLSKSFPVERMMRDAKAYQIFDGTNQIQKMIIGRYLQKADLPPGPFVES